jgi:hypothetical protein
MPDPITTLASTAQYAAWAALYGLPTAPTGIALALAQATDELQQFCGRKFLPSPAAAETTEARQYLGNGASVLLIDDCLTLTSITCAGAPVTDHQKEPLGETPTTRLRRTDYTWTEGAVIIVTGRFGYAEQAALPAAVVEACCMLAALRCNDAASWAHLGVSSVQAGSLARVDFFGSSTVQDAKRAAALALARPYRRNF